MISVSIIIMACLHNQPWIKIACNLAYAMISVTEIKEV